MIHDKATTVRDRRFSGSELLGYLPVLDEQFAAISYYSCENIHPEREHNRIVPCFHYNVNDEWQSNEEQFFMQKSLDKKVREDQKLRHEIYRDDYIKNFNENKFVVIFVGCDDGDKIMRFKDQDAALTFLKNITFYDEIFDTHEMLMNNY